VCACRPDWPGIRPPPPTRRKPGLAEAHSEPTPLPVQALEPLLVQVSRPLPVQALRSLLVRVSRSMPVPRPPFGTRGGTVCACSPDWPGIHLTPPTRRKPGLAEAH
jgi:hypothetical protein